MGRDHTSSWPVSPKLARSERWVFSWRVGPEAWGQGIRTCLFCWEHVSSLRQSHAVLCHMFFWDVNPLFHWGCAQTTFLRLVLRTSQHLLTHKGGWWKPVRKGVKTGRCLESRMLIVVHKQLIVKITVSYHRVIKTSVFLWQENPGAGRSRMPGVRTLCGAR